MVEFKGDVTVKRTLLAERRADQGLNTAVITAQEALVRHAAYWQSLSAAAVQDVVLPDATTLTEGWQIVVHSSGASTLTVKDNTTGTTIQTVATGNAYEFTCTDNSDADGTWFVNALEEAGDVTATRYSATFDATTSWGSTVGGYYTITVLRATHGVDNPTFKLFEETGSDFKEAFADEVKILASGNQYDILFRVPDEPDTRFAGKYIIM